MGLFFDLILSIPIGYIYNIIIHQLAEIVNSNISDVVKIQRMLIIIFGGGILGIILGMYLSKKRAISFGLYLGSFILLLHSLFYNWKIMENSTKIIIMLLTFGLLLWYVYNYSDDELMSNTDKNYIGTFLEMVYEPSDNN